MPMERIDAVVGVTGMNATDNPAPGVPVARSWGMTETGSQVATSAPFDDAPGLPLLPFAEASVAPNGRVSLSGPLAGPIPMPSYY